MPQAPKKRSGGPPQATGDPPPTAKRVKKEEEEEEEEGPDGVEESVFEAARRCHEARSGQPHGGGASRRATPGAESYAEWEERWAVLYPRDAVRAVGRVRRQQPAAAPAAAAVVPGAARPGAPALQQPVCVYVYVLVHLRHGIYIDTELDVVGTYATAASANEHAMVAFQKEYPQHLVNALEEFEYGCADFVWKVDSAGCLSLKASDEDGKYEIYVFKQAVHD